MSYISVGLWYSLNNSKDNKKLFLFVSAFCVVDSYWLIYSTKKNWFIDVINFLFVFASFISSYCCNKSMLFPKFTESSLSKLFLLNVLTFFHFKICLIYRLDTCSISRMPMFRVFFNLKYLPIILLDNLLDNIFICSSHVPHDVVVVNCQTVILAFVEIIHWPHFSWCNRVYCGYIVCDTYALEYLTVGSQRALIVNHPRLFRILRYDSLWFPGYEM